MPIGATYCMAGPFLEAEGERLTTLEPAPEAPQRPGRQVPTGCRQPVRSHGWVPLKASPGLAEALSNTAENGRLLPNSTKIHSRSFG
ncbi:hypothetical protein GCM10010423_27370 [Streptomyces levis]|uniref:Uncharacterized protein n=1 Tax=Streptomyces levis TaxID=285566 RepID=A0ABP6B2K7_9ACTN